eukprot:TRINITY_DN81032_c0_g1_i1.p1 TRINITY_DN81032_c0_g1~~TRINITY_DN81032_c0_g1_i1.p1  ORF type:complete len:287 (-),score=56.46 TRINITY_DN81032_c0_g1_i1:330-1139(-)
MAAIDSSRFVGKQAPACTYADAAYWLARYSKEPAFEAYDWYLKWDHVKDLLLPSLTPESEILLLGCGTSQVSDKLFEQGFKSITCVDSCEPLIQFLSDRDKDAKPTIEYHAVRAEQLLQEHPEWAGKFDLVLDKAFLDAVSCGKSKGAAARAILGGVTAVLKPESGIYCCVSHASPELRRPLLLGGQQGLATLKQPLPEEGEALGTSDSYKWKVEYSTVPRPLQPHAELDAKGKPIAPPKGAPPCDMQPSAVFDAKTHVYYVYLCKRGA